MLSSTKRSNIAFRSIFFLRLNLLKIRIFFPSFFFRTNDRINVKSTSRCTEPQRVLAAISRGCTPKRLHCAPYLPPLPSPSVPPSHLTSTQYTKRNYIPERVRFCPNERCRGGRQEASVLSDRGTLLRARVIGQGGRIRLGLAVSIDDNPRERSRAAYLTHYKSGIVRERDAGGYGD